jgi:hypothetical protein
VPPEQSGGLIGLFVIFEAALTLGAAALVVAGWRGQVSVAAAFAVAVVAAVSVLWVALLLRLAGH